jgi:hypothetical protein
MGFGNMSKRNEDFDVRTSIWGHVTYKSNICTHSVHKRTDSFFEDLGTEAWNL